MSQVIGIVFSEKTCEPSIAVFTLQIMEDSILACIPSAPLEQIRLIA
jgi:hypothetical protein